MGRFLHPHGVLEDAALVARLKAAVLVVLVLGLAVATGNGGSSSRPVSGSPLETGAVRSAPVPTPAKEAARTARLEALWADLADPDEAVGVRAIAALAAAPKETTEFLQGKLRPVPAKLDSKEVKQWLADLESDGKAVADRAADQLRHIAPLIGEQLRAARRDTKSEAAGKWLDGLLLTASGDYPVEFNGRGGRADHPGRR